MIDFGPTAPAGAYRTASPYHSGATSSPGSSWNTVGTADVASGLVFADGSSALGVSLNLGATSDAVSRTINLGTTPSNSNGLGTAVNTGIYAGSSVLTDGIYNGSSGNARAVGAQIAGLSAGSYDVYVSGRNTNTAATHSQSFYAGVSDTSGNFTFTDPGYLTASLTFVNATTATTAWAQGANYVKFSVTLDEGDFLNIASFGGTAGEQRGFLNMIQVVNTSAVPEPSAAALLAGLCAVGHAALRRRRR